MMCATFSDIGPPAGFVILDSLTIHHRAAVCAKDTCTAYIILLIIKSHVRNIMPLFIISCI